MFCRTRVRIIYHLEKRARQLGVDIRVGARVVKLLRDDATVTGVEVATDRGGTRRIGATFGVILATGDYSSAKEIKAQFMSADLADIEGINPTSTGDGQRMVQEAGGDIVNGEIMLGPEIRFVAPPSKKFIDLIPPIKPIALGDALGDELSAVLAAAAVSDDVRYDQSGAVTQSV